MFNESMQTMWRPKYSLAIMSFTLLMSAGCSNQAAFEIMQSNKIKACERMAEGQAREDCLRGYEKTYDQYERERNEVIGDKKRQLPELKLSTEKAKDESNN